MAKETAYASISETQSREPKAITTRKVLVREEDGGDMLGRSFWREKSWMGSDEVPEIESLLIKVGIESGAGAPIQRLGPKPNTSERKKGTRDIRVRGRAEHNNVG